MQSTQNSEVFGICSFCLSTNRRTTSELQLSERLLNLTAYSQSTQLCWECNARLKSYLEFCERAERAQEVLNQVNTQESLKSKSLSRLVISNTLRISIDSQTYDKNNKNSSDDTQLVQVIGTVKKETESVKKEIEILLEFETEREYADDYYETKYSNSCDDPIAAINLPLKKYDDCVGNADKLEGSDNPKCLKMTVDDKPTQSNSKDIHLNVKKSSNTNCSENLEIDYEQFEKFIATEDEIKEYLKPIFFKNKCKVCLRELKTVDNYMKHMKKFHSDCVGKHKCDVCGFGQPTETALKLHRRQHYVLYRCLADGCRFVHKFPESIRSHQAAHKSMLKNVETYACQHCKKKFKSTENVLKHITHAHLDAMKCKHCGKDFKDRKSLHQHIKLLHVDLMVVCDICGVKYVTLSELRHHLLNHRNLTQKKYACKICNKSFSCRFKERIHQFVHNDKPRIRCHLCKTEFIEEEARMRHLESKHGVTKEEVSKNPPPYKGRGKKKGASTKCELCGKDFKFPSVLDYHIRTRHSDDRPFKCHICSDGFKTKSILENHIKKHSDERAFKCDVCNKSFKFQCNLYSHKVLHTGVKPFVCNICGTSFARKENLRAHIRIHTGEKKFDCNVCGKKFPTKSCLKKHIRIH